MKAHPLRELSREAGGEYVLGLNDLDTHACYMIYGELKPGEESREVRPGQGHEEILLAISGDLQISGSRFNGLLKEGEAMHFREDDSCFLGNPSDEKAVYVLAGGHSASGH